MKTRWIFAAVLVTAFVLAAFSAGDDDDVNALPYDQSVEQTVDGTVLNTEHELGICRGGVFVTVKNLEVYLGPKEFVRFLGLKLETGEAVTIVGSPAVFHETKIVLARSITAGQKIFVIRDREGIPKWLDRPFEMDPECTIQPKNEARLR
jgi:hypothetical protein